MGESFLTPAFKNQLNNTFNDLHATFGRPIAIFRTALEIVIENSASNNYLFDQAPFNSAKTEVVQSGVFLARILYGKKELLNPFQVQSNEQNMIRLQDGEVRIKLDPTGASYLGNCERVRFDNTLFTVDTPKRPHGLFDPNFQTFFLRRSQ